MKYLENIVNQLNRFKKFSIKSFSQNERIVHYLFLALIIFTAGISRIYDLQNNPPALNQDEAVNGYDAFALGNTWKDHHGASFPQPMLESFSDWTSPLITYITIPFVKVFGLSEFSIRLPVAIMGVLSVLLFYILIRQIFKNKNYALIGGFIWAVSPWTVSLTRWAIPPSIAPFFILGFLNLFFWAVQDESKNLKNWKTWVKFILAGIVAALTVYTYPTMKLYMPLFVAGISLIYFRKHFWRLAALCVIFLAIISPIFYLTIKDPAKYNARYSSTSISNTGENVIVGVGERYIEYFTPAFAFGYGDVDAMHKVPSFSSIPEVLGLFFYFGLAIFAYRLIRKKNSKFEHSNEMYVILLGTLLFPVAASITADRLMLLRTVHGFIFITFFIVLGIKYLFEYIQYRKIKLLIVLILVMMCMVNLITFMAYYTVKYKEDAKVSFNYGLKETFEYVNSNEDKYNKIVIDKDIMQIYYLFYSQYDANKLHAVPEPDKFKSFENGKVVFQEIKPRDLRGFKLLKVVQDEKRVWYAVYGRGDDKLIVRKVTQYKAGAKI